MGFFDPIWLTNDTKKEQNACIAVEHIYDDEKLKEIALRANLSGVVRAAVARIQDSGILRELALSGNSKAASYATDCIEDEEVLREIAFSNGGFNKAIDRLGRSPELLKDVALHGTTDGRRYAIYHLEDHPKVMRDIFLNNQMPASLIDHHVIACMDSSHDVKALLEKYPDMHPVLNKSCEEKLHELQFREKRQNEVDQLSRQALLQPGAHLAFACPVCGSEVEYREDFESIDSYRTQHWFVCTGEAVHNPDKEDLQLTLSTKNFSKDKTVRFCPICREQRDCRCSDQIQKRYRPAIIRFVSYIQN